MNTNSENLFVGIDTSNYTTSICITDGYKIIAEKRRLLPVKEGERGLRQSDALFHHTNALPKLCEELFDDVNIKRENIRAIGVSYAPRDIKGSYMPCFLAGVSFASAFATALSVPLYRFSHQSGHIMAAVISGSHPELLKDSFIAFHVSGGTTDVVRVSSLEQGLSCETIGGSYDLNAGQAIDRCGVMLGIPFPCGAKMDELSALSTKDFSPKVSVKGAYCNLSGLENITNKMISENNDIYDICKFTFSYVGKTLFSMSENLRKEYPTLPIIYAGGVMSNSYIRKLLKSLENVYFALPFYSCDNAYGTACLAANKYITEHK